IAVERDRIVGEAAGIDGGIDAFAAVDDLYPGAGALIRTAAQDVVAEPAIELVGAPVVVAKIADDGVVARGADNDVGARLDGTVAHQVTLEQLAGLAHVEHARHDVADGVT